MWEFLSGLISGVMQIFTQQRLNEKNWQMQNQYNQEMWNNTSSPQAQERDLREAGLSDSAIGQALSGYSGASINLSSAPMQPNNINEALNSAFGNLNLIRKTNAETDEIRQNIKESNKRLEQLGVEIETAKVNHDIASYNLGTLQHTYTNTIRMSDLQLNKLYKELGILTEKFKQSQHDTTSKEYEALVNKFKKQWFLAVGVPYDEKAGNPWEAAQLLLKFLGGMILSPEDLDTSTYNLDTEFNEIDGGKVKVKDYSVPPTYGSGRKK